MTLIEDRPLIDRIAEMERHVGLGDWNSAAPFFTENVHYQVAGRGTFSGFDGLRRYMNWQRKLVTWTGHTPQMMIEHEGVVIIEVISHFRRLQDGAELAIPCTDIYRFEGDRICDWRVYADTAEFSDQPTSNGPTPSP